MVYKVALTKSLLELLTSLGLETVLKLCLLAVASARAFGQSTAIFIIVSVTNTHYVMGINFSSFR